MTNKEQLIYLAGLVDGEGCLSTNRSKYSIRARLSIDNTNQMVLQWVKLLFGGGVYKYPLRGHKQAFSWVLVCNQAVRLVECLLPYLKIKREEAEVFIRLKDIRGRGRQQIAKKLKQLKR